MLKIVGAGLVLSVAAIWGFQMKQRLAEHLRQLIGLKEILLMLEGEITYTKAPLKEAFCHIAAMGKEPFGQLLAEVAKRLEQERGQTLYEIWKSTVFHHKDRIFFSNEELQMLVGLGENMGYLDINMQINHLELYRQQVEVRIAQAQQELAAKQKMYQYLSVMGGLFLILVLV